MHSILGHSVRLNGNPRRSTRSSSTSETDSSAYWNFVTLYVSLELLEYQGISGFEVRIDSISTISSSN